MRLDKFLADAGLGSRSDVKNFIKKGRVSVDGFTAKKADMQLFDNSQVCLDGEPVIYEEFRYFLLNKPAGCVTANSDNRHKTVMDYLASENIKNCSPVGRLDLDTEGLLLITNDGALSHRLLSPSHHVKKTYFAVLDKPCPQTAIELFKTGVDIGDDKLTLPAELEILDSRTECRLTIMEGRFHQVKRMFEKVGCTVTYLKRESMGGLALTGLETGQYRKLSKEEALSIF